MSGGSPSVVSRSVINAAGEGGSMGFGGPRVLTAEEALLADLNSALTPPAIASKTIPSR
ncbi:MAG: hypothetical protein HGA45_37900 [Chloroflexales bacterium]|nr:hypothetical protein [Chloroflexales bacterium]